jgi:hypothetical protein
VESCRDAVRKHKADLRKKEEERRAAEEEAKRAEEESIRLAKERQDKIEAENSARERKRLEDSARQQREKQEREKRQRDDARTMALAQEARRAEQEMLDARNREREERTAKLEEERNAAADRVDEAAGGIASRIASAAGAMKDAIAGLGSSAANSQSNDNPDFDIPDEGSGSDAVSFFSDIGGVVVPWSGINFSIIKNAADATSDLSSEIGRVLSDFEHADPARLEAAFAAFPQRVFGVRPILTAMAENAVSTGLTEYAVRALSPAIEAIRIRERLAPRNPEMEITAPRYSWFTEQVERADATVRKPDTRTWVKRDAVFLPAVDEADESPYADLVKEWVVGYWVGRAVSGQIEKSATSPSGPARK